MSERSKTLGPLERMAVSTLKPFIPGAIDAIERGLQKHLDELPLMDHETRASICIAQSKGEVMIYETYFDNDDKITRIGTAQPARAFVESMINQFI